MTTSETTGDWWAGEDARCIVDGVVEYVGEDRLADLGITPEMLLGEGLGGTLGLGELEDYDLDDDEVRAMVDAYVDCLDMQSQLTDRIAVELPRSVAECMASEAFDDDMRDSLIPLILYGETTEEFSQQMDAIFVECSGPTTTATN